MKNFFDAFDADEPISAERWRAALQQATEHARAHNARLRDLINQCEQLLEVLRAQLVDETTEWRGRLN